MQAPGSWSCWPSRLRHSLVPLLVLSESCCASACSSYTHKGENKRFCKCMRQSSANALLLGAAANIIEVGRGALTGSFVPKASLSSQTWFVTSAKATREPALGSIGRWAPVTQDPMPAGLNSGASADNMACGVQVDAQLVGVGVAKRLQLGELRALKQSGEGRHARSRRAGDWGVACCCCCPAPRRRSRQSKTSSLDLAMGKPPHAPPNIGVEASGAHPGA
mmetsp:Transcript_64301/g.184800  ORF Transcript_64301/g.184800 Transcript_64301/m.184800 type:complete len:221 (-) Transcript_64301:469-1131(-)